MNTKALKTTLVRKALIFLIPLALLIGFAVPGAQAQSNDHRRHDEHRQRDYRHGNYRHGHRSHHGYYRTYRGRRYWYEGGRYYSRPGGIRIRINL